MYMYAIIGNNKAKKAKMRAGCGYSVEIAKQKGASDMTLLTGHHCLANLLPQGRTLWSTALCCEESVKN